MNIAFIFRILVALISFSFFANGLFKFVSGQRSQTLFKLLTNSFVWIGIALFSLFPSQVHLISEDLGFGESLNTFIFIGFIIVFAILFKIINILERTEHHISEIVRKEALSKIIEKEKE